MNLELPEDLREECLVQLVAVIAGCLTPTLISMGLHLFRCFDRRLKKVIDLAESMRGMIAT